MGEGESAENDAGVIHAGADTQVQEKEVPELMRWRNLGDNISPQKVREDLLEWVLPPEKQIPLEQEVGARFELRMERIQELVNALNESHKECASALCKHGIRRCNTGYRLFSQSYKNCCLFFQG